MAAAPLIEKETVKSTSSGVSLAVPVIVGIAVGGIGGVVLVSMLGRYVTKQRRAKVCLLLVGATSL